MSPTNHREPQPAPCLGATIYAAQCAVSISLALPDLVYVIACPTRFGLCLSLAGRRQIARFLRREIFIVGADVVDKPIWRERENAGGNV